MKIDLDFKKLEQIQLSLAKRVQFEMPFGFNPKLIAGVDISYSKAFHLGVAAAVVIDKNDGHIIEKQYIIDEPKIPYRPTFLGFREVPFYYRLIKKLDSKPDLIMVDGFGVLHPRKCGSATHLGIIVKKPTIGIGKTYLIGSYQSNPQNPGDWTPIVYNNEVLGALLKPNKGKHIYISPGNLIDLKTAVEIVWELIPSQERLPKPIYCADNYSKKILSSLK